VGGFPEVVGPDIGFLSKTPSPDDIQSALMQALAVRDRWSEMGAQAARVAQSKFGWDGIAARTERFYHQLIGAGPESRRR
jgi:glycosyltransferase involved in cell wall biosynthesis